jgi:dihydrofolate synthase/folylpolyglutamate synthase
MNPSSWNLDGWFLYLRGLPSGLHRNSLVSVRTVADRLGLLDIGIPIITIAGTNGKGTTVIFLESILRAHGFSVGSYISPHLLSYNERIRHNGESIDNTSLCLALSAAKQAAEDIELSYFDVTTLAALVFFKQQKPDYLILEVGIGGRLDTVNIFDPLLAIITTVSLDHTQILGKTRELIGHEKAGIMRPNGLAIVGSDMPTTVYDMATSMNMQLYVLGKDFNYRLSSDEKRFDWNFGETHFRNLPVSHLPTTSAALAIMATRLLLGVENMLEKSICHGLSAANLLGRMQEITFRNRKFILDIAHNAEAAKLLAANLRKSKKQGKFIAVFNALGDKDVESIVANLIGLIDYWYLGELNTERRSDINFVAQEITKLDHSARISIYSNVPLALEQAIAEGEEIDTIVIFGSFYVVSEALAVISKET